MAIISSDDITLTRVDDGQDGDDGFSPTVNTTTNNTYTAITADIPSTANPSELGYYELVNNEYVQTADTSPVASKTYYSITDSAVSITITDVNGQQAPVVLKSASPVYNALKDVTIFNQLTNGGSLQGMFTDESGHAYFNGQYLRAEGADIGGFTIGETMLYTDSTDGEDLYGYNRKFTIINSDPYENSEDMPAFAAGSIGVLHVITDTSSIVSPQLEHLYEYSPVTYKWTKTEDTTVQSGKTYGKVDTIDMNSASAKIMHNGRIYAGKYTYRDTETDEEAYGYNFKVDEDYVYIGNYGHEMLIGSYDDESGSIYGNSVELASTDSIVITSGDRPQSESSTSAKKPVWIRCSDLNVSMKNSSNLYGSFGVSPSGISFTDANNISRNITADPVNLCSWGTYSAANTTVTLRSNYTNYRFLILRFGTDPSSGQIGGISLMTIPTSMITSSAIFQHEWYQGTALQSMTFSFTRADTFKVITRSGSVSGLRQILGYN